MWPWEHLAVAYVLLSLGRRSLGADPPSDLGALAVLLGSQLPDLVDKPLAWGLGWFPSGFAIAHSLLVAVPAGVAVLLLARRRGRLATGGAFVVGYWSHLLADVLSPLRAGAPPAVSRVLWPFVDPVPYETDYGLGRGLVYLERFLADLAGTPSLSTAVFLLVLPGATLWLWVADGLPGVGLLRRGAAIARR